MCALHKYSTRSGIKSVVASVLCSYHSFLQPATHSLISHQFRIQLYLYQQVIYITMAFPLILLLLVSYDLNSQSPVVAHSIISAAAAQVLTLARLEPGNGSI